MTAYSFDKKSLFKDGRRWFPIMGEIHYSRCPESMWRDSLLKMKEGGVDIVSSYVIWIHHEEIENQFDWSGQRNLRKFVQTVAECGLVMILRIGPWSHAEVRHGGFPDWLVARFPNARKTNDEAYFAEVEKFYKATFDQVKDLLLKNGGPIIGVQIENEYGHCGGLKGEAGEKHMRHLQEMAREIGFDVPLYTATGWGGAVTAGMLPVMGGYCEAPWDPRTTEIEPSGNYVFTYERNDHAIGCDFGIGEGITFDMEKFPYLTAELGGGLQITQKRRPVSHPKDIGAMSLAKIGSGCTLLGYYMYHGGQNPEGKLTTLEENVATGSLNDMSVKNYDFRAPLGEYGFPNGTYDEIRLLSLFVHDFGEKLAASKTEIPNENPIVPENNSDLRTSVRRDEKENCGFIFVNNFQRRQKMSAHNRVSLSAGSVNFPEVDIADGDFFFLPFNMKIGNGILKTSLATPLCRLDNEREAFVFYSAATPSDSHAEKKSSVVSAKDANPKLYQFVGALPDCDIVTLSRADALKAHKVFIREKQHLLVTESVFFQDNSCEKSRLVFESDGSVSFKCFPALEKMPEGFSCEKCDDGFFVYECALEKIPCPEISFEKISDDENCAKYKVCVGEWNEPCDVLVDFDYDGNCARLFENDVLLDDEIYHGKGYPWQIALERYGKNAHEFILEIDALKKGSDIFIEEWPDFGEDDSLKILHGVKARALKKTFIDL